ncbi:MAG TPA: UDP-N-acetylmuramate--L-alanine ligase, partial [Cyanobacteria bacterium UBA12227]|nr:UDP-N-acetylmuramate--L-alanine ligase [Cyanobacteria bacterium UBA12227]
IPAGMASFEGIRRRFERRGEANGILFVDDYAHHPSEIQATLAAARLQVASPRRIIAIFQPHRYSRTLTFLPEFAKSFGNADLAVLTDIYSAGEPNLEQITGEQVQEAIAAHQKRVYYEPTLEDVCQRLTQILQPGDLALFLGAGNLNQIIPQLVDFYQTADRNPSRKVS